MFFYDSYFMKVYPIESERKKFINENCKETIIYCLRLNNVLGYIKENKLVGFVLLMDYNLAKNDNMLKTVFSDQSGNIPFQKEIHHKINELNKKIIYIISICVDIKNRRKGIASEMIDYIITNFKDCYIVSDISNILSLPIYKNRNFKIDTIYDNYFLVIKDNVAIG